MSYLMPHLPSGWHVDEAIKSEEDRVVVIRFGHDWDDQCMVMDNTLYEISEKVQNYAVIYLCEYRGRAGPSTRCRDGFLKNGIERLTCARTLCRCTSFMILALSCSSIGA